MTSPHAVTLPRRASEVAWQLFERARPFSARNYRYRGKDHPYITFRSTKITQKGPHTFDVLGTFNVRGISKVETLTFTADREGEGTGEIEGILWFERGDFGLGGSIPFVKIADRVELTVEFKATRVSGLLCYLSNNQELYRAKLKFPFLGLGGP